MAQDHTQIAIAVMASSHYLLAKSRLGKGRVL
jgi:hypothetical protein